MSTLYVDIETYSSNDIKQGVHKYVDAPDFEILLLAYAFNDDPVTVIDLTAGEKLPAALTAAFTDASVLKTAFNAAFEITCIGKAFPELICKDQWECDSVLSLYHSLPAGLDAVGKAIGLPQDKQKDARGKRLIQYFCKPCKPTKTNGGRTRNLPEHDPEAWDVFKEYNAQDVVTERAIRRSLLWLRPDKDEHTLWLIDRAINDRGIRIDTELAQKAVEISKAYAEKLTARAQELTGLDNPNSVTQLKKWLAINGHPVDSLGKEAISELLAEEQLHPTVREVLSIRQRLGKTSIKKYDAMLSSVCEDGRAHDLFQFYGSRTGRWAGRNIQLQNLARNYIPDLDVARDAVKTGDADWIELLYDNVPDVLSQLTRTALVPAPGMKFIVADFSAIEARVLAWIANETWELDAFREGRDIYCAVASQMFGVPVEKHGVNGELRSKGKVATLACGYGGGVPALKAMGADKMGLSDEELLQTVTRWRKASPKIPALWQKLETTAIRVVRFMQKNVGARCWVVPDKKIGIQSIKGNLLLSLPSGRYLVYNDAAIGKNRFGNDSMIFKGINQTTRKIEYLETYGGKLTENLVQAVARDCLAVAMRKLEARGYKIVAHVHDEVICEVPDSPEYTLDKAIRIMTEGAVWTKGLPLDADGFESYYYKKD